MRRKRAERRKILPDVKYNNPLVARLINKIILCGKKSIAEKIVYKAFDIIADKTKKSPLEIFEKAVKNVSPEIEVKSRRIGGATYQVPVEVKPDRKISLALEWIITYARLGKKGKPMCEKLASELLDAYNNTGASIKKREDTYRMAEANKAFAHYRW